MQAMQFMLQLAGLEQPWNLPRSTQAPKHDLFRAVQAASKEQSWRKVVQRGGYSDKLTAIAAQLARLAQRITCEPGAETPMGGGLATPTKAWQTPRFVSACSSTLQVIHRARASGLYLAGHSYLCLQPSENWPTLYTTAD